MKKEVIVIGIGLVIVILFLGSVLSYGDFNPKCTNKQQFKLKVVEKDSNGNPVPSGAYGYVNLVKGFKASAIAYKLEAFQYYTLIYYKIDNNNESYIECINSKQATRNGNLKINQWEFDYSCFPDDSKPEKFWIVKSKDIDCQNHRFISFNPEKYLLDIKTI